MKNWIRYSGLFLRRNASTILTCAGAAGVVVTSIMAVKATPKALKYLEQAKEEKGDDLTVGEIVNVAGPVYIPTLLVGASTIVCIFSSNVLNKRHQAMLSSAYMLANNSFKEYKNKLKELYGEETHNNIINSIMVEKAEDMRISSDCFFTSCDLSLEDETGEPVLFYDEHSGRYFEATIEQVITAEYHLNRNFVLRGYVYLNEFYEFLGIEETDYGSVLGWAVNDEMYWIDFNHRKAVINDDLEVYIIETPYEPSYDFLEW